MTAWGVYCKFSYIHNQNYTRPRHFCSTPTCKASEIFTKVSFPLSSFKLLVPSCWDLNRNVCCREKERGRRMQYVRWHRLFMSSTLTVLQNTSSSSAAYASRFQILSTSNVNITTWRERERKSSHKGVRKKVDLLSVLYFQFIYFHQLWWRRQCALFLFVVSMWCPLCDLRCSSDIYFNFGEEKIRCLWVNKIKMFAKVNQIKMFAILLFSCM